MSENAAPAGPPVITLQSKGSSLSPFYQGHSDEHHLALKLSKKRQLITNELLATEEEYVENLNALLNVYRRNLRDILSEHALEEIFLHLDTILQYNSHLLSELQQTIMRSKFDINKTCIGGLISKLSQFLFSYAPFITHFSRANDAVAKAKKREAVRRCLEQCQADARCKGRDIFDFLIMPVQRLPRYSLLLSELLEATPPAHPDHEPLSAALHKIRSVADRVNLSRQQSEDFQLLQGIKIVGAALDVTKGTRAKLRDVRVVVERPSGDHEQMQLLYFTDLVIFGHLYRGNRLKVYRHYFLQELLPLKPMFAVNGNLCIGLEEEEHGHHSPSRASLSNGKNPPAVDDEAPSVSLVCVTLQAGRMRKFQCLAPFDATIQELCNLLQGHLGDGCVVTSVMMGAVELIPSQTMVESGIAGGVEGAAVQTLRFVVSDDGAPEDCFSTLSRISCREVTEVTANPHSTPSELRGRSRRASVVSKMREDERKLFFRSVDGASVNSELFSMLESSIAEQRRRPVDLSQYKVSAANASAVDELMVKKDDGLRSLGRAWKERLVSPGRKVISRIRRLSGSFEKKPTEEEVMTQEEWLLVQSCLSGLREYEEPVSHH